MLPLAAPQVPSVVTLAEGVGEAVMELVEEVLMKLLVELLAGLLVELLAERQGPL